MDYKQILEIKNNLVLIGRTRDFIYFYYLFAAADGEPYLKTSPKPVKYSTILEITKTAKNPRFLKGIIQRRSDGLLELVLEKGSNHELAKTLLTDLVCGFDGKLPIFESAILNIEE